MYLSVLQAEEETGCVGSPLLPPLLLHPHAALSHDSNGWFSTSAFSHLPHLYDPPDSVSASVSVFLLSALCYLSFYLSVSVHQSLSVLSRREQRFINVPGWFLVVSAASDVHQLLLIKKHSLLTVICPVSYHRLFFLLLFHQTLLPLLFLSSFLHLVWNYRPPYYQMLKMCRPKPTVFLYHLIILLHFSLCVPLRFLIHILPAFASLHGLCVRSRMRPGATVV